MTVKRQAKSMDHASLLCWSDLFGLLRCRGVPAWRLAESYKAGMGWAAAGLALTTFETPADSPWGPMTEVRQLPIKDTETFLDLWTDASPFHAVLCEAVTQSGDAWECCPRQILKSALKALHDATGLSLYGAVEHEFTLLGTGFDETMSFSVDSMRRIEGFWSDLARAFRSMNFNVQTLEPEAGRRQYEVSCAPAIGIACADQALIIREVIREAARRRGYQASFSPKPFKDKIGSGAHFHFSFLDKNGRNVTSGAATTTRLSPVAQCFASGVIKHLPAITAFFASSPISYLRLGAGNWSCGYASFGIQNREAALRVCPPPTFATDKALKSFNLECRALDAASNPYLAIAAIIYAGLDGIRQKLPAPFAIDRNPAQLESSERERLGIKPIPSSLASALAELETSCLVADNFGKQFKQVFATVLAKENELAATLTPEKLYSRYLRVY